jgi:hypothetical protein
MSEGKVAASFLKVVYDIFFVYNPHGFLTGGRLYGGP